MEKPKAGETYRRRGGRTDNGQKGSADPRTTLKKAGSGSKAPTPPGKSATQPRPQHPG